MTSAGGGDSIERTHPIEFREVAVRYGSRVAVRDVSFTAPAGRITAILGPTGCGKTSLLSTANRTTDAIPRCKVSGAILWAGSDVRDPSIDTVELRRQIGLIAQRSQPFPASIRRNLELLLREFNVTRKEQIEERVETALSQVGLWSEVRDRLDRPSADLSPEQQQRLLLARALVLQPSALLLDEPCAALDARGTAHYESLLLELRDQLTMIVVAHHPSQAKRIADRVALLWPSDEIGGLLEVAETSEFFSRPTHPTTAAFLSGAVG